MPIKFEVAVEVPAGRKAAASPGYNDRADVSPTFDSGDGVLELAYGGPVQRIELIGARKR
jgi:hypothetical protein